MAFAYAAPKQRWASPVSAPSNAHRRMFRGAAPKKKKKIRGRMTEERIGACRTTAFSVPPPPHGFSGSFALQRLLIEQAAFTPSAAGDDDELRVAEGGRGEVEPWQRWCAGRAVFTVPRVRFHRAQPRAR